jgi:hypothetical protein
MTETVEKALFRFIDRRKRVRETSLIAVNSNRQKGFVRVRTFVEDLRNAKDRIGRTRRNRAEHGHDEVKQWTSMKAIS